ncbi:unnamed protein product, partial [Adineta steineri]
MNALETSFDEQNRKIEELTTALARQEVLIVHMKQMLEKLVNSNRTTTANNQEIVQPISTSNNSDFRLSTDETLLNDSSENNSQSIEIPINQNENVGVNVLSKSNPTTNVENQAQTNYVTTTVASGSDVNGHLSTTSDPINKIKPKKKQRKTQVGQWCHERNPKTTTESPGFNRINDDDVASAIASSSYMLPTEQQQHERNFIEQNLPSSNSIDSQLSTFPHTTNETAAPVRENGSIECSLLHSLQTTITSKTGRATTIKDCSDQTPVLIIHNDHLHGNTSMKISMVSSSIHGDFYSTYQFVTVEKKPVDTIHRKIEPDHNRIELSGLKVKKVCNHTLQNGETFKLKSYPSGEVIDTEIEHPLELTEKYNLKEQRLCIRFFRDGMPISDQVIFFSNPIIALPDAQTSVIMDASIRRSLLEKISLDFTNPYSKKISIKLSKLLNCTLRSGYK